MGLGCEARETKGAVSPQWRPCRTGGRDRVDSHVGSRGRDPRLGLELLGGGGAGLLVAVLVDVGRALTAEGARGACKGPVR